MFKWKTYFAIINHALLEDKGFSDTTITFYVGVKSSTIPLKLLDPKFISRILAPTLLKYYIKYLQDNFKVFNKVANL